MDLNDGINCCGIVEIEELSHGLQRARSIQKVVRELADAVLPHYDSAYDQDRTNYGCAFLLFSGVSPYRAGLRLKGFIEAHDLGTVWETDPRKNPNSGHMIRAWIWGIDHEKLGEWRKGLKEREGEKS